MQISDPLLMHAIYIFIVSKLTGSSSFIQYCIIDIKLCQLNEIPIHSLKLFVDAKSERTYFWESIRLQQCLIVQLVKEYRSFC